MRRILIPSLVISVVLVGNPVLAQVRKRPGLFRVPEIRTSWDDLLEGVKTKKDWKQRRAILKKRYLELIRDQYIPEKPPLELKVHESVVVAGKYVRKLISYNVEADERAHAYLGIPLGLKGKQQAAGLVSSPDKAYLDHLCRRGYVVIAPEHFVSGHRVPPEGSYETARFYKKHPQWTAVGKFTYEHSIAIDVLQSLDEVDAGKIGALGHSLGGHGTFFWPLMMNASMPRRAIAGLRSCGITRVSQRGPGTGGVCI